MVAREVLTDEPNIAEEDHWTERGRAASVANSDALGRPRRSVLSFDEERLLGDQANPTNLETLSS